MADVDYKLKTFDKDVKLAVGIDSIKNSIKNIVTTQKFQVPGNPDFGCDLESELFGIMDEITYEVIREKIIEEIIEREPRITISKIDIVANFDTQQLIIEMFFVVIDDNSYENNLVILVDL